MLRTQLSRRLMSLVVLSSAAVAVAVAQEGQPPEMPKPSPEHEQMAREAGEWNAEITLWHTPGDEPAKSKGTETNTMFGKFWMLSEFKSDFGGMEYTGRGQFGYDPVAKKCVGTWIDTWTPFVQNMEGSYDEKTHTLTMTSKYYDMMAGKEVTGKNVTTYIDDNTKKFEMYAPGPDGKEYKMMEVMYTRKK